MQIKTFNPLNINTKVPPQRNQVTCSTHIYQLDRTTAPHCEGQVNQGAPHQVLKKMYNMMPDDHLKSMLRIYKVQAHRTVILADY